MTTIAQRADELSSQRVPYVRATVVRAQVPSSAKAGDEAIVLMDGTVEGFVGGDCAESSVRTAALGTLVQGETLLLRVLPEETGFPAAPGAEVVVNPCLSGGALEIFLRPVLPPPLVQVVGHSPVAQAVVQLGKMLDYTMETGTEPGNAHDPRPDAVVIASHGRDDEAAIIRAALDAGAGYIALVASQKRGQAVLDALALDAEQLARVSTPAGLWIGARTAPEVALSILAEVVSALRLPGRTPAPAQAAQPQALDPVCGMTVTPSPGTPRLHVDGTDIWFCGEGCRTHYAAERKARAG